VRGLTQAAAKELAEHGITVNSYCPGIVDTKMWEQIDEGLGGYLGTTQGEAFKQYSEQIPLGRAETPDDVAGFVSYLAGPDANYMTGQSVSIDGGIVMI
jgi:meso-butanediol dehydrogenase/(S,S)-butanediol dehydrogenase/diacetyl reductase